jgi:hydrogenase maturation factor
MKSRSTRKIIVVGPMLGISIPQNIVKDQGLKKGDPLNVTYDATTKTIIVQLLEKPAEEKKDSKPKEEAVEVKKEVETATA